MIPRRCPNPRLIQSDLPPVDDDQRPSKVVKSQVDTMDVAHLHVGEKPSKASKSQVDTIFAAHTSERLVYTEYRRIQSVVRTSFRTLSQFSHLCRSRYTPAFATTVPNRQPSSHAQDNIEGKYQSDRTRMGVDVPRSPRHHPNRIGNLPERCHMGIQRRVR